MSAAPSAPILNLAQLLERVRAVDPSAVLVAPRILRRVIRLHRELPGVALHVPHRKSYEIDRADLLHYVSPAELRVPADSLPERVLLLRAPTAQQRSVPAGQVLLVYWRLLFHAHVHRALATRTARGLLGPAEIQARIDALGAVEFDEARQVLRQEKYLFDDADLAAVYEEFAAVYLELATFDRARLKHTFPAPLDPAAVEEVLRADVPAEAIFHRTRLPGSDEPDQPPPAVVEPVDVVPAPAATTAEAPAVLLARADEVSRRGNQVRAAILRVQAARAVPGGEQSGLRGSAYQDVARLARRLRLALGFPDAREPEWLRCLWALVEPAARGVWTREARLLYDLQKVCVEYEKPLYAADLVEWIVSGFRRPVKRPLPDLPLVLAVKHLQKAELRLAAVRLPDTERRRLGELIQSALAGTTTRLRQTLGPRLSAALDAVGLPPASTAERLDRDRLVEELLDRVIERGHLSLGDLRDAVARNRLKLADLSGPGEFFLGDPLIRANRRLAADLDGIYRRGEIYLRWMQRLSSLFFGTQLGRTLTLFLILPFLGSLFLLKGIDGMSEELHKYAGMRKVETFSLPAFFLVALVLVPLVNSVAFRRGLLDVLHLAWQGLRRVFYELPAALLQAPLIQRLLRSRLFRRFMQYLGRPLLWTLPLSLLLYLLGSDAGWNLRLSAAWLIAVSVLLNTTLGVLVEESVLLTLVSLWHALHEDLLPGLFRWIIWLSRRFVERVEQLLYTVDEWLRFRQGESMLTFTVKVALGLVWFAITYVVRFVIVLLVEPQINPIKHFPVVTVSHKLMLLIAPPVADALTPLLGMSYKETLGLVFLVLGLIPGVFGFLAWELKENWKLYRANQPEDLTPRIAGSHGERVVHLVRPGFHSGTLPGLFARLRRASGRKERRGEIGLHHVEDDVRRFVRRGLLAPLRVSNNWPVEAAVEVGHIHPGIGSLRIELCAGESPTPLWLELANRDGWLTARLLQPGWAAGLTGPARVVFRAALLGFYKHAGVDLVMEQMQAAFPDGTRLDLRDDQLSVRLPDATMNYPLREPQRVVEAPPGWPTTAAALIFTLQPIRWQSWVDFWQADQAGRTAEFPLLPGVTVLPRDD